MWLIKSEKNWLIEHAEQDKEGFWRCKKTNQLVQSAEIGRSIWIDGFSGGFGEVRTVTHLNCPGCHPNAVPPQYGEPIQENLLVEVGP